MNLITKALYRVTLGTLCNSIGYIGMCLKQEDCVRFRWFGYYLIESQMDMSQV